MLKSGTLAILILWGAPVRAEDLTPKDLDVACAVGVSIELVQISNADSIEWWAAFSEFSFYLGRLTVRDNQANWRQIIKGRVAEGHNQRNSPETESACLDLFNKTIQP